MIFTIFAMNILIFYACFIVLATVASAPVDNYLTLGTVGVTTPCDVSNVDCSSSSSPDNDNTISSADLNQAFAFPSGAGAKTPFLSFAAANSVTSEENGVVTESDFTPTQFGRLTVEMAGNPQSQAKAPTTTYDCQNPSDIHANPFLFTSDTVDDSLIPYGSLGNTKPSSKYISPTEDDKEGIMCKKCTGPKDSDCRPMLAACFDQQHPNQCMLCFVGGRDACEMIDDISILPSRANKWGQPWCVSQVCRGARPCLPGFENCISL